MKSIITIIVLGIILVAFASFMPQVSGSKVPKLKSFFACKQSGKIEMSAEQFRQFMKYPICAKDSLENVYKVSRFEIMYAETGLYQDSAGLPIIHTDYQFGTFVGDSISQAWQAMFDEHAYKGDTVRIINIRAKGAEGLPYRSQDIELILR